MNNKIIAPILTENKVNSIAEKYCKSIILMARWHTKSLLLNFFLMV